MTDKYLLHKFFLAVGNDLVDIRRIQNLESHYHTGREKLLWCI